MSNTSWLPRVLRWMFTVFTVLAALLTIALCIVYLIDPKLPGDAHFGPFNVEVMGQHGNILLQNSALSGSMFHDNVQVRVDNAGALLETLKRYGLPLLILNALFFAILFDLFRRLFRNVGHGESFTMQTVRLVQITGLSLLAYSLIAAVMEGWFQSALFGFLVRHSHIVMSGTAIQLPQPPNFAFSGGQFPFGTPYFLAGLLVLALSEVFRQGLALKKEHDLTI